MTGARRLRLVPGLLAIAAVALGSLSCSSSTTSPTTTTSSTTTTTTTTSTTTTTATTTTTTTTAPATTLTGLVTDVKSGSPVASATVAVQGKTATTGADGRYTLTGLTDGNATLTAQHQGHINFTQSVTLAGATTVNVSVTPSVTVGFAGSWSGSWTNTTFGSTGTMTMALTTDTVAQTLQMLLDVNGSVFGGGDPPAETYNGTYTAAAGATFSKASSTFGLMTITISPTGQITGSATNIPASGISRFDFTGTATTTTINLSYTVTFTAGTTAKGTAVLNKP